tara:strand:- start:342 stop:734 length:393 start_codon:yes stop_codon:yes gene_type:complete
MTEKFIPNAAQAKSIEDTKKNFKNKTPFKVVVGNYGVSINVSKAVEIRWTETKDVVNPETGMEESETFEYTAIIRPEDQIGKDGERIPFLAAKNSKLKLTNKQVLKFGYKQNLAVHKDAVVGKLIVKKDK